LGVGLSFGLVVVPVQYVKELTSLASHQWRKPAQDV
jgi:hypothetical protein